MVNWEKEAVERERGVYVPVNMKNMIAKTFADMAEVKSVDKITVKDLVEACSISRQTFYYHFQDIMDVIEWTVQQATDRTLARSLAAGSPQEALGIFVADAVENRQILKRLLHSQRREELEKIMLQATRGYLQEMVRHKVPNLRMNYADLQVALDFYAFGVTGLLLKCCGNEQPDRELLTGQLYRLLSGKMIDFHLEDLAEAN